MKFSFAIVPCLVLAACSSGGGSSSGFCADLQASASQLAPCIPDGGSSSGGGQDGGVNHASCQMTYSSSSCSDAARTRLDAIGTCINGLGNCSPSNFLTFFEDEAQCYGFTDGGMISGVSAQCSAAFGFTQ